MQTILKKLKVYDTILYICEVILYIEMYLIRFKTNSVCHLYDTRNKSDFFLLEVITPNYLNRMSLTTVCFFITKCFLKLKVLNV